MVTLTASSTKNSLSVDMQVYFGQNQIRRNVSRSTSFYPGSDVNNQVVQVSPNSTQDVSSTRNFSVLSILVDNPVGIRLYTRDLGSVSLTINKLLVLDDDQYHRFTLTNLGIYSVNAQISYATVATS